MFTVIKDKNEKTEIKKFKFKFGILFEDYRNTNVFLEYFTFIDFSRILLIVFTVVLLYNYPFV